MTYTDSLGGGVATHEGGIMFVEGSVSVGSTSVGFEFAPSLVHACPEV